MKKSFLADSVCVTTETLLELCPDNLALANEACLSSNTSNNLENTSCHRFSEKTAGQFSKVLKKPT